MKQTKTTQNQTVEQKNVPEMASMLIIVFALLYTAGWSFAYHYFGHFNVGLSALELPKEDYFIFSYWVIADHKGLLFFGVVSFFVMSWGWIYTIRLWVTNTSTRFYLLLMILPIVILTLFAISYRLGTSSADIRFNAQKAKHYYSYPSIEIFQKKGASPTQLTQSLTSGCYRQLIQNKDKVFVFRPIKSVPQLEISTLVIPMSQVHSMRLLPERKLCD